MGNRFKTAKAGNVALFLAMAFTAAFISLPAQAANITLQGTIATDDAVQRFDFTVATAGSVDIRSYGYAGGTTSNGTVVARGGFDSILTLFSASGVFINENDDGAGVATDPPTDQASDARITANLMAGTYILTLTQYDNFSIGNLADGFVEQGKHTFTADPSFAPGGACPGNMFRDISGTDGRCRNGNWAVSFNNVASVTPVAPIPEPSLFLPMALGLGVVLLSRVRRLKKAAPLASSLLIALTTTSVLQAQSDPDFSNTEDILHGKRTLLEITDFEVNYLDPTLGPVFTQITTSNSNQTAGAPFNYGISGLLASKYITAPNLSAHMFNQKSAITVTTLHNYKGYGVALWLQGLANATGTAAWTPLPPADKLAPFFVIGQVAADFTGDGFDDVVLAFGGGKLLVVSPKDTDPKAQPAEGGFNSGQLDTGSLPLGMAVGDFNGDGRPELAVLNLGGSDQGGLGSLLLNIYTVDPVSLALTQVSSLQLAPADIYAEDWVSGSIATGRFNTTAHDQLALTFTRYLGSPVVTVVDFAANSLTPTQASSMTLSDVTITKGNAYLQVATGNFAFGTSPYDQIVFHVSSATNRFFEVMTANPTDLTLTAHTGFNYNNVPCAAWNGLQVGNFDHQQSGHHNPSSQIAFLSCNGDATSSVLSIYDVDPQTFNVNSTADSSLPLAIDPISVSFVPTDIQGRSMQLGAPNKITIENTTASVINAVPPMHIDYITPVGGNKPEVVNLSYAPDGFNSAFKLTQQSTTGGSTTHTLGWSAGVDISTSYDYQIGDPDEGTGTRFSAGFDVASQFTGSNDNSTINYSTSNFDASKTAKTADVVLYDDSRMNIWVYPVIGQTVCPVTTPNCSADQQKPLTIQFSGPDNLDAKSISADLISATWYQPAWEWGNVLSYPATRDQLNLIYPELAAQNGGNLVLSSPLSFFTDNSSTDIQASWSSNNEQGSTSSLANTTSFDVSLSGVSSIGVSELISTKFSASVKLSGSVALSKLQMNNAKIDASNGVDIQAVAKFLDPGNYAYEVKPFILGNFPPNGVSSPYQQPAADFQTFGPLKTAFTANPIGTGAWWQGGPYSAAPDVALNHPSRWTQTNPSVGGTLPSNCINYGKGASDIDCADIAPYYDKDSHQPLNPWLSEFLAMRGFFVTRADSPGVGPQLGFATAGDKLDLAVRVYNYSLAPTVAGNQVHIRFYAMPWDSTNNVQVGDSILISETVADPIPPFDPAQSNLNWRLIHSQQPFDTTPYVGKFFAFWVVVWMEDSSGALVKEIGGHGLTSKPGQLNKPSDVPLEMAIATDGATAVSYSNNVGFYHYAFPVMSPNAGLGAPIRETLDDITLKNVSAAKKRVQRGELNEIIATLRAGFDGGGRLKVYFYDGDPDAGAELIGIETAWLQPRTITKVRLPYHAPKDGVYQIWAVINKGKPSQITRHTAAILVGNASVDRYHSDGDDPQNDKSAESR